MCANIRIEEMDVRDAHVRHPFFSPSMHISKYSMRAPYIRLCVYVMIHEHVSGTAADLADFADISLARAAPLTFSWCQINLDLARCHIHLGTHL